MMKHNHEEMKAIDMNYTIWLIIPLNRSQMD